MSKKATVNFMAGLRKMEEMDAVRRHPAVPEPEISPPVVVEARTTASQSPAQRSRRGKVAITQWVDPAVRKQLARLASDQDRTQAELMADALNLLFEKYGLPPIAAPQL